ncbi:MAG: aminotransferase class V-fold PLP-dependent enzyme [Candidatus Aminicenantes bacterium]|nr:aminotransferase class V-fold PLP-dependent enzyme [Candidatus Aminicenantes bacterium]
MLLEDKKKFQRKSSQIFLAHCSVSPLYNEALKEEQKIAKEQNKKGLLMMDDYLNILDNLRTAAAGLLKTKPENLAFVKNTSEGMSMIANGFRFQTGDQTIGYIHEYPANYYPWKLQERRGVEFVLLPNRDTTSGLFFSNPEGEEYWPELLPCGWSMADLEARVTGRTRIIAISHVQFTSGFAADLKQLGEFCRSHDIDLIVDAAQSLGALPLYPEEYHISAVVSSGWKWLMGPLGTGIMYTSEEFRAKIGDVQVGAGLMIQGTDFLNHSWHPHTSAKRFEYSTCPVSLAASLTACIKDLPEPEKSRDELFRLQNLIVNLLDPDRFTPVKFPEPHRSGILSVICRRDNPQKIEKKLQSKGIVVSERSGYIRFAPHFYNTEEEISKALYTLDQIRV